MEYSKLASKTLIQKSAESENLILLSVLYIPLCCLKTLLLILPPTDMAFFCHPGA